MAARRGATRRRGIQTPRLTRSGANLQVGGVTKKFSGVNAYWLGLDDNQGGNPGVFPSQTQITNAMVGIKELGANLVRAHTVGMSAGTSMSFETAAGVFNDGNMASADWAVYQAKLQGIYLSCPLTDNWNYYHGGKWNFVHWAYQQNPSGITDTPGTIKDDVNERIFYANTAPGLRVRALFKDYISAWLNHFNPYTGLRYKDDPTIAIVETGNELYYAAQLGTNEWTQDIASYIKGIAPNKLVMDGSAADRVFVSASPGLNAAAVDILSAHYYPQQQSGSYPPVSFADTTSGYNAGSALQQIAQDATNAFNAGKPFIIGEFPWTRSDVANFYSTVEGNSNVDGDMPWSFIGNTAGGTPLTHGTAFGTDDYPIHRPYAGTNEQQYAPALARHISAMTGIANGNGAGISPSPTPESISGMTHRFRTSNLSGFNNGDAVTSASFQTGGLVMTVGSSALAPVFLTSGQNGRAALRFDGANDYLAAANPGLQQGYTVLLVLDVKSVSGTREFMYMSQDFVINDGTAGYNMFAGQQISGGTPTTGMHSLVYVYNQASSTLRVDGTQVISGDPGANGADQLSVGRHPSQGRYAQMDLYEVIFYNRALNTTEQGNLRSYAQSYYGI